MNPVSVCPAPSYAFIAGFLLGCVITGAAWILWSWLTSRSPIVKAFHGE